jgi:hypothetical protein
MTEDGSRAPDPVPDTYPSAAVYLISQAWHVVHDDLVEVHKKFRATVRKLDIKDPRGLLCIAKVYAILADKLCRMKRDGLVVMAKPEIAESEIAKPKVVRPRRAQAGVVEKEVFEPVEVSDDVINKIRDLVLEKTGEGEKDAATSQ